MNFKLNHYYVIYFSIFTSSLCLLSDKSDFHDTEEKNYKFEISTEEILRRRKLVEPYMINIEENQRDWIDTYQSSSIINEIPSKIKFESEDYTSKKHLLNNGIPAKDDEQQIIEKDWTQLNFDSGKRKLLPDIDTNAWNSPAELLHRHKIVEDFITDPANLEKVIDETTDHLNSKDINPDISSYNCDGSNNIVSNTECNIKADEDISEVILESALPEFTEIEKVSIESSHSVTNKYKKDVSSDRKMMSSVSSKNIITAESGKGNVNSDLFETEKVSEANKLENFHNDAEEGKDVITHHKFKIISEDAVPLLQLSSSSEEHLQRQKLVKSFVSTLNEGKENWKETYEFSKKNTDSEEIQENLISNFNKDRNAYDSHKPGQNDENNIVQQVYNQDRLFFTRWLKKLLNKFDNFLEIEDITVKLVFTNDVIKEMKNISNHKNFDIADVDKVISNLISNAVVQSSSNLSGFFDISASVSFYVVVSIILLVSFYFILLHYRIFKLILIILICITWHGFKMYQEKVAEKHAVLAGSSPAYCDSILNKESGLFAHIKEFFRYNSYNDHCKKYFDALMIDPISDLSLSIIVSDFVSATLFQVFRPMGRALNAFVKDTFSDLSFVQAFYLIILVILFITFCVICVLIYNKYKLNFPLFMGSVEPSVTPCGSRIEDLFLEHSDKNKSVLKRKVSKKYISVVFNTKDCASSMMFKNSSMLIRRYSF